MNRFYKGLKNGTSVHEALNMVDVDAGIKQQISKHATFVAERENETLGVA